MAVAVNQEQIIGSLIPDVYIKTITMETAGTVIRETNPHIQHPRETRRHNTPTSNSLLVTLDLLLKEELDNSLIDTWFSDQDFQKYLRFTVIQSTNPLVTKILSASNNAIQIANINSLVEAATFVAELMGELKQLPEFASIGGRAPAYTEDDIPELMDLIYDNTKVKYVSVKEHMLNNKSLLNQQYQSTTDTGHRVYDFTFRIKFELPTKKPEHLSYFAVSSIDIDQLIADFNLDTTDRHLFELMNGKVVLDTVVSNSNLVSKSFIFKDAAGDIWSGPVHEGVGGWLTGAPQSDIKQPLSKHEVENSKIQDFRNFDEIERLQMDFSVVQNRLSNRSLGLNRFTNDNMDVPRVESYFSEAALTTDSRSACRFAFAMDYGKLIRDYTKYGALYSASNQDELFANVRIRNFVIKRRRVTRAHSMLNKLGSPIHRRDVFSDEEPVEVICRTGESVPGRLKLPRGAAGTVRELPIELNADFGGVRHFTGIDQTMPVVTDGFYQYGVEIEVEDRTHKFILKKINELSRAKHRLDWYYNLATLPEHFDLLANRFTEAFIDKMQAEYGWEKGQKPIIRSPWIRPVVTYLSILSFFRRQPVDFKLATSMWKYVDPKSGNPRGVAMIQKLIENLMQRLASVVGVNLSSRRSKGIRADADGNFVAPASVLAPGKPALKVFKIEHYFPQVFDSNLPKDVGYDFLSQGSAERESTSDGLRVVSRAAYEKRTERESLKYFNSLTDDINMKVGGSVEYTKNDSISATSLTYLTPSSVHLANLGTVSLLDNPFDAEANLKIQTTLSSINLNKKSPFLPYVSPQNTFSPVSIQLDRPTLQIKDQLTNIMANFNCTLVVPISSQFHNLSQLLNDNYDPYTDVDDIMGKVWSTVDVISGSASDEADMHELFTNLNPNPLFAGLAFPLFSSGVGLAGTTGVSNFRLASSPSATERRAINLSFNMDFYDLNNTDTVGGLLNTLTIVPGSSTVTIPPPDGNTINSMTMMKMAQLPNQIKSLFLASLPNKVVRYDWSGENAVHMQSPVGKPSFILNYKTLRKTEVLTGYRVDDQGHAMLKYPIWKPLSRDTFHAVGSNNLLCRSVKYENKAFGIRESPSMRMPVYNKYFIISGVGTGASSPLRRGRLLYRDQLSKRIKRILKQHRFLRGEYLSTAVVSARRIVPTAATKQRVIKNLNLSRNLKPKNSQVT